jgi:hypothetical protein
MRQCESQEFFPRRFALRFGIQPRLQSEFCVMMMLGNSETTAAQDPIDAGA